jgi:hypothetical protein
MANKSFSQYLAEARAKQGASSRASKPVDFSAFSKKPEQPALDVLSWAIDIASRPMRAIQNIPNQVLNEVSKAQQAQKTGTQFNVLGAIGNIATAPARGFFSNNPEDQPYGAQLIEKATDVVGANDPRYKDTQDNVNPWVKGIGGFALDVGLDPITYLPGGIIAAGTRGAIAGAKASTGAGKVKGAWRGIKVGDETLPEFKIGSKKKQLKPVGIDQLRQNKAYDKLQKESLKNNILPEAILKFSKNEGSISEIVDGINSGIWAKARESGKAVPENQYVTPESFLATYQKNQKLIPAAQGFEDRLQAISASSFIAKRQAEAAELAAEQAAKQADAGAPIVDDAMPEADTFGTSLMDELDSRTAAQPKPISQQVGALAGDERISAVLRNALDSKQEVTQAGRVKPIDEWVSAQLELSKTDPKLRIVGGGKSIPAARLADYARLRTRREATLSNAEYSLKEKLDSVVPEAYDDYVKSLGGTTAPKAANLSDWLASPANRAAAEEALGEEALKRVGVLPEAEIESAFKFLSKAIEDPDSLGSATAFGVTAEQKFAEDVVRAYQSRTVEDLPAVKIQEESRVNSPVVAEINAANEAGEDLFSQPWASGLESEEEAKLVVASVKAYFAEMLRNRTGMRFDSPKGAKKSDPEMFKGTANFINQFNGADQTKLWNNIAKFAYEKVGEENFLLRDAAKATNDPVLRRQLKAKVKAGGKRAGIVSDEINRLFKSARMLIDQETGVVATLGKGDVRSPIYLDQAIDVLRVTAFRADSTFNRHLVDMALFNRDTAIPMTNFDELIAAKLANPDLSDADMRAILRQTPPGTFNILTDKKDRNIYGFKPGKEQPRPAVGMRFFKKLDEKDNKTIVGWFGDAQPIDLENALVKLIDDALPELQKVVDDNRVAFASRVDGEYLDITNAQWEKISRIVLGGDDATEGLRMLANISTSVGKAGAAGRATVDAQANAARDIADLIANDAIHDAQDYIKTENILSRAKTDADIGVMNAQKNWKDTYNVRHAEERVRASKDPLNGVDEAGNIVNELDYSTALARESYGLRMGSFRRALSIFNKQAGAEDAIWLWAGQDSNYSMIVHQYTKNLRNGAKKFNTPIPGTKTTVAQRALLDVANKNMNDPLTKEAVDYFKPFIDYLFGTDMDKNLSSVWLREGANLDAFETYITRIGRLEFPFDKQALALEAKQKGIQPIQLVMEKWGDFLKDVDNPFDFLERMNAAATRFQSDKALALSLKTVRGGVSSKPAVGFSSIGKNYQYGENPLLAHLPADLIVNDDLLAQIKQVESIMLEGSQYRGIFEDFINNKYAPGLSRWKVAVTVFRLGHHIRNDVSNKSIQLLLDGAKNFLWSQGAGWKVLNAYRSSDGLDMVKLAQTLDMGELPKPSDKLFSTKRFGDITVEDANKIIEKGGLFENYASVEDVIKTDQPQGFTGQFIDRVTLKDTFVERGAAALSETISWQNRAAHVLQFMRNNADSGMYSTLDELGEAAVQHVRRAQPSNVMLTSKEKQIRLAVPFYGWFRQAIPVVAEGIVNQPGRFMMVPKASFNLAIAMGVNPYQMYDPFPDDQPFPSYVKDQLLGPVALINDKYYTANPGLAPVDLINQFVPDPIRGIAGMLTPVVKVPGEVLGGASWGTGARINDMSDYWDAQLPGINYISNFTGTSVTGSVYSLLTGQGLDPQYAVDRGSKTPGDQGLSVSNWFTGMGVQNVSKPSFIRYAQIEERNRIAEEAKRASGEARSPF